MGLCFTINKMNLRRLLSYLLLHCVFTLFGVGALAEENSSAIPPANEVSKNDILAIQASARTIAPLISYSSTYKLIYGIGYFQIPLTQTSSYFGIQALSTFEQVFQFSLDYGSHLIGPYSWGLKTSFSNFYDPYYGEGISTDPQSYRRINLNKSKVVPELEYALSSYLSAGLFLDFRSRQETSVDGDPLHRLFPDENALALGLSWTYDDRDRSPNPGSGGTYKFLSRYNPRAWTNNPELNEFSQHEIDLRRFEKFSQFLLAIHLAAGASAGDPGILYRYKLGGSESLRGYHSQRFRGKHYYLGQLEGRWSLKPERIDGVIFSDAGSVTDDKFSEMKTTVGFGFRFALPPSRTMKVRLDFGFASDETSMNVAFGEVF